MEVAQVTWPHYGNSWRLTYSKCWVACDTTEAELVCSCHDLRVKGKNKKESKIEKKPPADYDKVICSMSEWVEGLEGQDKEHTSFLVFFFLRSRENRGEPVNRSSQWPWGTLVLCQNFWLDDFWLRQSLSRATSAGKMLEWRSKMCWHTHWQHAHGRILRPE